MGERCEIFLEKAVYYPGDTINGRVDCHFFNENKVTAIKCRIKGKAKVHWTESRNSNYDAEETYFERESDLLANLPSSMNETDGNITYSVKCKIDRPWAIDYTSKKIFEVHFYHDLNSVNEVKIPYQLCEKIVPKFVFLSEASGPITIMVKLPVTGFVPSQMISFWAYLKNDSGVTVQDVHFKLIQGFTFYARNRSTKSYSFIGQEFAITESNVISGNHKSWDLELRVPAAMFNRSLEFCSIIKVFWELRGEICLPLAYKNIKIRIPFTLGNVPLMGTSL